MGIFGKHKCFGGPFYLTFNGFNLAVDKFCSVFNGFSPKNEDLQWTWKQDMYYGASTNSRIVHLNGILCAM